jgi:hypothetical protein
VEWKKKIPSRNGFSFPFFYIRGVELRGSDSVWFFLLFVPHFHLSAGSQTRTLFIFALMQRRCCHPPSHFPFGVRGCLCPSATCTNTQRRAPPKKPSSPFPIAWKKKDEKERRGETPIHSDPSVFFHFPKTNHKRAREKGGGGRHREGLAFVQTS